MSTLSILRMESKIDIILTTIETLPPKYRWCVEQFGPEGPRWSCTVPWLTSMVKEFKFADDRDLMLFILRWS
jgi:hypothetical protein